jgi:hypothetical protein
LNSNNKNKTKKKPEIEKRRERGLLYLSSIAAQ